MIIYTRRSTHKRTLHIPRWTSAVRLQVEGCRSRSRGRALYRDASRAAYVWPTSFKGRRSRTRGWCHIRVNRPAFSGTDFEYLVPLSRQITLFPEFHVTYIRPNSAREFRVDASRWLKRARALTRAQLYFRWSPTELERIQRHHPQRK